MTKRDYILLANLCKKYKGEVDPKTSRNFSESFVKDLCDVLKRDNPRFDTDRFLKAVNGG